MYHLFCIGIPLVIFGIVLKRKGHQPPPPSDRFSLIRKYNQKSKEKSKGKE